MSEQIYEFLKLLKELKLFTDTTAVIYSLLLIEGSLSKAQIISRALREKRETELSLKHLIELRLVNKDRDKTSFKYYATNPSIAWSSLEAELIWRLDTSLRSISDIQSINASDADNLRKRIIAVKRQAQKIYKPQVAVLNHRENDVQTNEEFAQMVSEMISQARKEIFAVSKSPRLKQVSLFWTVLTERIKDGVQYTRIVDLEEVIEHGLKVVQRDIEDYGIELLVLEQNYINHKFYIVDKKFIAIYHGNNLTADLTEKGFGRLTCQHEIINRYRKRFQKYKNHAIPGLFVLENMQKSANRLAEIARVKLTSNECSWVEDIIKYGKFSTFHEKVKWSKEEFICCKKKAIEAGLVLKNSSGYIVPSYDIGEADIREFYRK